ncbi:MAG: hypothetical protein ABA06_01975 [Parcubacteria bacterium C7867-001]|nr:MAG: hypothetical protein ABA06_01975 [Parcubacteria bacterium C7867-001]
MGEFFLTWLSYFLIFAVAGYALVAVTHKNAAPGLIIYAAMFYGPITFCLLVVAPFICALISRGDPLGWLWSGIAHFVTKMLS